MCNDLNNLKYNFYKNLINLNNIKILLNNNQKKDIKLIYYLENG